MDDGSRPATRTAHTSRRLLSAVAATGAAASLILAALAAGALPATSSPSFGVARVIPSPPADGTIRMGDNEGSAYVPNTGVANNPSPSIWLAEDNEKSLWELNARTGAFKSRVRGAPVNGSVHIDWLDARPWNATTQSIDGAGPLPIEANYNDLEALAYDKAHDRLYAFSGSSGPSKRTVFRLARGADGRFHPDAYQELPGSFADGTPVTDATAAAWNPADGNLYVGFQRTIRQFTFETNMLGDTPNVDRWTIPGSVLGGVHGMTFDPSGGELITVWGIAPGTKPHTRSELVRLTWPADPAAPRTQVPGWGAIDLTPFDIVNARDVELIDGRLYIGDGADTRAATDPHRYAVFVLVPCCQSGIAATAGFTFVQPDASVPTVQFTDASTGGTSGTANWAWDFGDGQRSGEQSPSHTFPSGGTYRISLVATNAAGASTPSVQTVTVAGPRAALLPPVRRRRGTTGTDTLRGTNGSDELAGLSGNDRLDGGAGDDRLLGGPGRDLLTGGSGRDTIQARDGERDTVDCGPGRDTVTADAVDALTGCEVVRRS